jgi:PadR family transcriptional regulator PadR
MSNFREFYSGFIRLHILYHSAKEEIFGLGIIGELRRHGYELSPGTLYPILHDMEEKGYISSTDKNVNGKIRRLYRITPRGQKILKASEQKIRELFHELLEQK